MVCPMISSACRLANRCTLAACNWQREVAALRRRTDHLAHQPEMNAIRRAARRIHQCRHGIPKIAAGLRFRSNRPRCSECGAGQTDELGMEMHRRHSGTSVNRPQQHSQHTCDPSHPLFWRDRKSRSKMPTKPKSRREAEAEVRSWGFSHVFTWTDSPYVSTKSPPTLAFLILGT